MGYDIEEIDEEIALTYFVPKTFKIGLFSIYDTDCRTVIPRGSCGFPSCRFRGGNWTDVQIFEKLTEFKPTNQVDKAVEIKKCATGAVTEYENVPTDGFTVVGYDHRSLYSCNRYYNGTYDNYSVFLEDPRGWTVAMTAHEFFTMLEDGMFSIAKGGKITGADFVYTWDPSGLFKLKPNASKEVANALRDDYFEEKKKLVKFMPSDELEFGKVYDFVVGKSKFSCFPTTRRAVYLGKLKVVTQKDYEKVCYFQYVTSPFGYKDGLRKKSGYYALPWENKEWKDGVAEFKKAIDTERHVFLVLDDSYSQNYGYFVEDYFDHYLDDKHNDFALSYDSLRAMKTVGGKVIGLSEDQRLCPSDEPNSVVSRTYASRQPDSKYGIGIQQYTETTAEELLAVVKKKSAAMKATISSALSNFPTEEPDDAQSWLGLAVVGNHTPRRSTEFRKK